MSRLLDQTFHKAWCSLQVYTWPDLINKAFRYVYMLLLKKNHYYLSKFAFYNLLDKLNQKNDFVKKKKKIKKKLIKQKKLGSN